MAVYGLRDFVRGGLILTNIIFIRVAIYAEKMHPDAQPERWWTYTLLFTVNSCIMIWLFAASKGRLTRRLTSRGMSYLAKISPYMFLIHYVVLQYLTAAIKLVFGNTPNSEQLVVVFSLFIGFPVSVICSHVWEKNQNIIKHYMKIWCRFF